MKAKELKFTFREFKYDPEEFQKKEGERTEASTKLNQMQSILKQSCENNY